MKELKKRMSKLFNSQMDLCINMQETLSREEKTIFFDVLLNLPGVSDYIKEKAKTISGITEENVAEVMSRLVAEYRVEYKKRNKLKDAGKRAQ